MTTQHTHHEHSDVDASVVEHPSAPENETQGEASVPANETSTADASSADTATPTDQQEQKQPESISSQEPQQDKQQPVEETQEFSTPVAEAIAETSVAPAEHETGDATHVAAPAAVSSSQPTDTVTPAESTDTFVQSSVQEPPILEQPLPAEDRQEEKVVVETPVETTQAGSEGEPEQVQPEQVPVVELVEPQAPAEETGNSLAVSVEQDTNDVPSPAVTNETDSAEAVSVPTDIVASAEPQVQIEAAPQGEKVTEVVAQLQAEQQAITESNDVQKGEERIIRDVFNEESGPPEDVRPFTDFIAEFRQAEAALQATLRDSQVEALSILSSVAADLITAEQGSNKEQDASTEVKKESIEQVVPVEVEKKVVERPVSPLLRPASRLRLPRHGVSRHHREEQQVLPETQVEPEPAKVEPQAPVVEPAPTRPARRYRFDRPAATTHASSGTANGAAQTPPVVPATPAIQPAPSAKVEEVRETREQRPSKTEPAQVVEPQKPVVAAQEAETPAPQATPVVEHSRRRHSQKEQHTTSPVQQVVPPVIETPAPVELPAQPDEIAPEDLPPLEYAELQKASSRRRRRHRSGTTGTPATTLINNATNGASPQVPITPPAPVTPPVQPPATPQRPVAQATNTTYTLVSGYTVNQMNQGNEASGPFMGPEPSPARGSVFTTRDGRTNRAETRTTQAPSPVYPPARPAESGLTTAAMTQFANIVSQALQTQTDRMVSEFRRISQAPTNVSVTLPPFPSTERVGVFVDVANLLYSARTLRMGVDFGKLLDFLRGNRRLVRAHAYCPTSPQPSDDQMFLQAVKGLGYRITTKNYKTFSSGAKKADLDLDLCMDVVRLVDGNAVDCIVLVSGDSDFMPMLDYCSDHGVRVEVAAFDEAMSATLRQSCDLFVNLSMLEEIRA